MLSYVACPIYGNWQARRYTRAIQTAHPLSRRFRTMADAIGYASRMNRFEVDQCSVPQMPTERTVITPTVSSGRDAPTTCVPLNSTPCSGSLAPTRLTSTVSAS